MPAPSALTGKRRAEAKRLIASGASDREIGRKLAVDHKTVSRLRKLLSKAPRAKATTPVADPSETAEPEAHREPRHQAVEPLPREGDELDPERILDDDLRARVDVRNRLIAAIEVADDPRCLAMLAKELGSTLDGIRRVVSAPDPEDGEEDVEAGTFDAYMLQLVAKGRVIVNAGEGALANPGVPGEAEPTREVGDRAGSNGTDG